MRDIRGVQIKQDVKNLISCWKRQVGRGLPDLRPRVPQRTFQSGSNLGPPAEQTVVLIKRQCHLRISWRAFKSTRNWAPTPSVFLTGLEVTAMLLAWGPLYVLWPLWYLGCVLELPWNPCVCLQSDPHRHLFPVLVLLCFALNAPQMVLMPVSVEGPSLTAQKRGPAPVVAFNTSWLCRNNCNNNISWI